MHDSISLQCIPVGQMQSNCFFITENQTESTIIIDPGDDGQYLLQTISSQHLKPVQILATHGHFDHVMAVTELKLILKIPFCMSSKDQFLLNSLESSAYHFLHIRPLPASPIDRDLFETKKLVMGKTEIDIIPVAGHTPGSVAFYISKSNILFCGDLVFSGGAVGRTDFSYSNHEQLLHSISKIMNLPLQTVIYPGHGDKTSVKELKDLQI